MLLVGLWTRRFDDQLPTRELDVPVRGTFNFNKIAIQESRFTHFSPPLPLGIECGRLPLERYIHWQSGNKTLTLVAMHGILATAKETNGDWKTALEKNIPARCLREHDAVQRDINRLFRRI